MYQEERKTADKKTLKSARSVFEGERLTLARLSCGLKKSELAERIGVSPTVVGQYEMGKVRPSSDTVLKLHWELGFPVSFFEGGRRSFEIKHEEAHFRRLRSTSKLERSMVLARAELLMELVEELEKYLNIPQWSPPDIPAKEWSIGEIERAAEAVRKKWGLGYGPITNVVRLLEQRGCVVTRLPRTGGSQKVDAFSTWMGTRPIIVLSSEKDKVTRWRFDASHELGHLVLHPDAEPGSMVVENQAHRFAAAFLMPKQGITNWLPRRIFWPDFVDLKMKWKVSIAALLRRSRDLGWISEDQYRKGVIQYNQRGWKNEEPGDKELKREALADNLEQPVLVSKAVKLLETRRNISQEDLADSLRIHADLLRDLISASSQQEKIDVEL